MKSQLFTSFYFRQLCSCWDEIINLSYFRFLPADYYIQDSIHSESSFCIFNKHRANTSITSHILLVKPPVISVHSFQSSLNLKLPNRDKKKKKLKAKDSVWMREWRNAVRDDKILLFCCFASPLSN